MKETEDLYYNIIASGSKGNAVVIDNILFDCGIAYKHLKESLYDIEYLVVTHIHSDHLRESTYNRIKKEFPHIQTIGNYEVHQRVGVDYISNSGFDIVLDDKLTLKPFDCLHDVVTHGYTFEVNGSRVLYATDTNNMDGVVEGLRYDYMFIESNHCEKKVDAIMNENVKGYRPYLESQRHLSTQKARVFYYFNRVDKDSRFIELHKSSRFY